VGSSGCVLGEGRTIRVVVADSPHPPVHHLFFMFIASFFVSFAESILLVDFCAQSFADNPWVEYGRSVCGGRSTVRRQTVHFSRCATGDLGGFSDGLQEQRRQSARVPRTVLPYYVDSPPLPRKTSCCFACCDLLPLLILLALFIVCF
jgi:hypothetical protein